jgi:hypothetical protein
VSEELTHKQLVDYAARWLRNKHPVVVTELATIGEEADAIGFYRGFTTLVECKGSRSEVNGERSQQDLFKQNAA